MEEEEGAALRRLIAPDTASLRFHLPGGRGGIAEGGSAVAAAAATAAVTQDISVLPPVEEKKKKNTQRAEEETPGTFTRKRGERSFGGLTFSRC